MARRLSELYVTGFEQILDVAPPNALRSAIDGGAGAGDTVRAMVERGIARVDAFEPFPGNHRFLEESAAVRLHKVALGREAGVGRFFVASTVREHTPGWEQRVGYSSVGRLLGRDVRDRLRGFFGRSLKVPIQRADDIVDRVDFVKLDLQGGEYDAICGMLGILPQVKIMWIEISDDMRILDKLEEIGFELFSTELLFKNWTDWHEQHFRLSRTIAASTGVRFYLGWRDRDWEDFDREFDWLKSRGLLQTDILAVNPSFGEVYEAIVNSDFRHPQARRI